MTDLPVFPDMRPITLYDRETIQAVLREESPQQSELTFANLFMWRDAHQVRVSTLDGVLLIFSWRADPEDSFLFPPLGPVASEETLPSVSTTWPTMATLR